MDPCCHGGICKLCIVDYLKKSHKCMICKADIEKIFYILYDEERKAYRARGQIKF